MCYFIYAVLPFGADRVPLRPIVETHDLGFHTEATALFVNPPGTAYRATARFCDCGTALGSALKLRRNGEHNDATATARLRKSGWSKAKITRWRESKLAAREKRNLPHQEDLRLWLRALPQLVNEMQCGWLGLVYHWHGDGQPIRIVHERSVRLTELTEEILLSMPEDVLYRIVPAT